MWWSLYKKHPELRGDENHIFVGWVWQLGGGQAADCS
jgi:hypothetical protein